MKETVVQIVARNMTARNEEKQQLCSDISDITKDLNGCRLRYDWKEYTLEELRQIRNDWQESLEYEINAEREDKAAHKRAVKDAFTPSPAFAIGDLVKL